MSRAGFTFIATALLVLLAGQTALEAENPLKKKLPALDGLQSYGCEIKGPITMLDHSRPDNKTKHVWRVTFWAEHKNPYETSVARDWKIVYAYRDNRRKGFDDCDSFFKRMKKAKNIRFLASR